MNSINISKVSQYKGAIIQYMCSECNKGNNFFIEFTGVSSIKPNNCDHFNINFLLSPERRMIASFNCKFCQGNKMLKIFDNTTFDDSGSISYKCEVCKQGNVTIGYLFQNENIDISDLAPLEVNPNEIEKKVEKNIEKKILIIFVYNNQEYKINVDLELSIPEAFHKLAEENKTLENLDIKSYSKDNEVLSQFKSIKKLNLKNGDKIFIKIRENQGW